MPTIWRYGFGWTGWAGAPGRSTFYGNTGVSTPQVLANDAYTLLNNIINPLGNNAAALPAGVTITGDAYADELDVATGNQVGRLAVTPSPAIIGVGGQNWAAPAGACITWSTNTFINGRRLRGRLFLVPLDGATCFATDGTLASSFLATLNGAIPVYIGAQSEPVVWHRPTTKGGSDGQSSPIVTGNAKDKVAVLRSRRD